MELCPARVQFCWCNHLCDCSFAQLGDTARAGSGSAFYNRRAIHLGGFCVPNLYWVLLVESLVGSFHSRSETMANWRSLAIDDSDLGNCSGNRFCTSLTPTDEESRLHSKSR